MITKHNPVAVKRIPLNVPRGGQLMTDLFSDVTNIGCGVATMAGRVWGRMIVYDV